MRSRVLLTDAQERAVLAAIRCLRRDGFSVTATATTRTAPGLWSRAPMRRRLAPDPRQEIEAFVVRLELLLQERRHDLLMAGTDASLLAISKYRHRLAPYVQLGLPAHEIVARALDKEALAEVAQEVDLAAPEARTCRGSAEALSAAAAFGYPVVVKPIQTVVERDGVTRRAGSRLVGDGAELAARVEALEGDCIVQRRAAGCVISFGGVATEEGLLGHVVSRYARTWPPEAGNVAFSETIVPPAGLVEKVQALVARIGWAGLFELELIQMAEGRCAAIDFNPRAYGSMGLASSAGVPLAALWCRWALGERPSRAPAARTGVKYRWEDAELRRLARAFGAAPQSTLEVARPHRDTTHAYFQLRDPAPLLARALQVMRLAHEYRGRGPR